MDAASRGCHRGPMEETLDVDHLVVGAGAMGMAFADALVDHSDVRVAIVDRRHAPGGHWLEAYPFVRLHQSASFYGVASTVLGGGRLQQHGPEAGLQERASQPEIVAYYERAAERMRATGRVRLLTGADFVGDRTVVSRVSGRRSGRAGDLPHRRRPLPRAHHPGRVAASLRGRRRRPGAAGQRPRAARGAAEPLRRRGIGQDRDRRDRVAARPGRRPRRDLLGAPARPVDAQSGAHPARPGGVPRHAGRRSSSRPRHPPPSTSSSCGSRRRASCCASTAR